MHAVGLITEYNPFHNGHKYQVQQAKTLTKADAIVAVMSGNFVQRGEPAIFDKWQRTRFALEGGVNLVLELPVAFALQPAHLFAKGAVDILADVGVETICFGAEHANIDFLAVARQAKNKLNHSASFKADFSKTYATQFNDVLEQVLGFRIESPNDLLGFAYAHALLELGLENKISLQPIQRIQAQYHDQVLDQQSDIASATALRLASDQGNQAIKQYVSEPMAEALSAGRQTFNFETTWLKALQYKVKTTPVSELASIYQLNDGLAYRLAHLIDQNDYQTITELLDDFKTKRFTRARLRRSLLYTLLNFKNDEMLSAQQQPYLRILGHDQSGRAYLKQRREEFTLPVINRVGQKELTNLIALDYRAGNLYRLFDRTDANKSVPQDTGRIPIIFER